MYSRLQKQPIQLFLVYTNLFAFMLLWSVLSCEKKSQSVVEDFTVAVPGEITTLDWVKAKDSVSRGVLENLVPRLMTFRRGNEGLINTPGLLRSLTQLDKSGRKWSLEIPEGLKWSDGSPLTATQVKNGLTRPGLASLESPCYPMASSIFGSRSEDHRRTVVIESRLKMTLSLKSPALNLPMELSKLCYSPSHGSSATVGNLPVTLGDFFMKSWSPGKNVVLERRERSPTLVQRIVILMNIDPVTGIELFRAGKVDLVPWIPPERMELVKGLGELVVSPALRSTFLVLNTKASPFQQTAQRRAFAKRVQEIDFDSIFGEYNPRLKSLMPPLVFSESSFGVSKDAADIGTSVKLRALVHNSDFSKTWLQRIQFQLKKNGVELEIDSNEWKTYIQKMQSTDNQLIRMSWTAESLDPTDYLRLFTSYSRINPSKWKSKKYDELYQMAIETSNPVRRKRLISRALELLIEEEAVIVPLFSSQTVQLVNKDFRGLNNIPFLTYDFSHIKRRGQRKSNMGEF